MIVFAVFVAAAAGVLADAGAVTRLEEAGLEEQWKRNSQEL